METYPSTASRTYSQHSLETLDLDDIFGGSATDLEDENEEPMITTTADSGSDDAKSSTPSITYPQHFLENAYKPKAPEPSDRSSDCFWENGRLSDSEYFPSVPVDRNRIEPLFHHLNFLGHPVYHKSSTPAEVSLWLAFTSHKKRIFHPFSRQGVTTSQATKHIDPFVYLGPEALLKSSGSELRNAVTGYVEKAYDSLGTWLYDSLVDEDENVPRTAELSRSYVYRDWDSTGELQAPHWMCRDDCDDTIINDDGKGSYTSKTRYFKRTPSKLCDVEFADYESAEVTPKISCMRPLKEDSEANESAPLSSLLSGSLNSIISFSPGGSVAENAAVKEEENDTAPGLDDTKFNPIASMSSETAFLPAEQTSSGYSWDQINKLVAETAAVWKDVSVDLRALESFLSQKFHFQATCEENEKDMNEDEDEKRDEDTYALSTAPKGPAADEQLLAEILCDDMNQVPLKPGLNKMFYGSFAIAVGHKAYQLADWVSSHLW